MEKEKFSDIRIGPYLTSDVSACVGSRDAVYLEKFQILHDKGYSFNWCSALFSGLWFAYRKMWKAAAIILLIEAAVTIPLTAANITIGLFPGRLIRWTMAGSLLFLAVSFTVFGLAGDWLYCKHVTGILDAHGCKDRSPVEDEAFKQALRDAGGVSLKSMLLYWVISLLLQSGIEILTKMVLGGV